MRYVLYTVTATVVLRPQLMELTLKSSLDKVQLQILESGGRL